MPLDELPESEHLCSTCGNVCVHSPLVRTCEYWSETGASRSARAEKRIPEVELALRKIHDRAHEWNAIPLCVEIERMAFDALGLERGK